MTNKFEELALWYLRLNGYLTVPNFILHPAGRGGQRGEEDILGVRFPYSKEVAGVELKPDDRLVRRDMKTDFIIAQVKGGEGECDLSSTWRETEKEEERCYVLKWLGMVPDREVPKVAENLYTNKIYETGDCWGIRLVCLGKRLSDGLSPNVVQIKFEQVAEFFSSRFELFRKQKRDIEQWPEPIKQLANMNKNRILHWLRAV
jgi:hypothetical protein